MDVFDLLKWVSVAFFLPHFLSKCIDPSRIPTHFELARWPAPRVFAGIGMFVELLVILSLVTGFLLRYGLLFGTLFLLVAAASSLRISGPAWRWDGGGPEYPVFWAVIMAIPTTHEWGLYQGG